ncbi:hypothetical protein R9C00_22615 [Flammeovirgaceae bacterium SG7u.111]|nr:hypothetical protein [Flammeovirgaceae bacterium SG7u.132]WPO34497.1 hypothetical protein R9C00_22615 [Flammeovirgaceae bacterium SG7u.111]
MAVITTKKPAFEISPYLRSYLIESNREISVPFAYTDLFHYSGSVALQDSRGEDTLWETLFYSDSDREQIHQGLKLVYAHLKSSGDTSVFEHLYIDRIDICLHGNTKPFRIRIVNKINDLFDYFYVKEADASRIYGQEIEHLLSPNKINYLVTGNTLIEEHIAGIPGDKFIQDHLNAGGVQEHRLAKEFVKFNERCLVQLLGDMRSDNYVVEIIPDFDEVYFRLRAIDFDQHCYEGRRAIYMPQYFKENNPIIQLGLKYMTPQLQAQYEKEERSRIATRIKSAQQELNALLSTMAKDTLSTQENIRQLRAELSEFYGEKSFMQCKNMGEILFMNLDMVFRQPSRKVFVE